MNKTVTYKEPKGYFNSDMKKVAKAWEKEQKSKESKSQPKKKSK